MSRTEIVLSVVFRLITVLAFIFSFLGYIVTLRPQIQTKTSEYYLGFIDGGVIVFVLTAPPLIYAYLAEKKKSKGEGERATK